MSRAVLLESVVGGGGIWGLRRGRSETINPAACSSLAGLLMRLNPHVGPRCADLTYKPRSNRDPTYRFESSAISFEVSH